MTAKFIRLAPVAYGYGPIGKAMHIARALRQQMGSLVRLELVASQHYTAACEPDLFDVTSEEPSATRADAVIAIMNLRAAEAATQRAEPVVFVDSLAWLWDKPLPVADLCIRYLYQDLPFLPVPEDNLAGMPTCRGVAAITGADNRRHRPSDHLVVSASGVENFEVSVVAGNAWYVRILADALAQTNHAHPELAARIAVYGNPEALKWAGGIHAPMTLGSGRQTDFLHAALQARRVMAPPGLTTLLELIPCGVPMAMLPPQNYSQVRIDAALQRAGADLPRLSWDSPVVEWLSAQRIPEKVGSQIIRNLICERFLDGGLEPAALARLASDNRPALSAADAARLIGETNGAAQVAHEVAGIL